jgi:predicted TIM-barrel fold metal-dependent hydrolase
MKNGYRTIDADTHVQPSFEVLEKHMDPSFRPRVEELEVYRRTTETDGKKRSILAINMLPFPRKIGEPPSKEKPDYGPQGGQHPQAGRTTRSTGHHRIDPQPEVSDENPQGRLLDMDLEGRDVDILYPGPYLQYVIGLPDPGLTEGIWRAYHNYMKAYCSADPKRLKGLAMVPGNDVEWAVAEVKSLANEPWLSAVWPLLPEGLPLDHPDLEPLWATLNDLNLPIVIHAFYSGPPYWPGYRDVWDNAVIARAASVHWLASRFFGYVICSGMLDRYPNLKAGVAEVGHGWLPHWLIRLGEQIAYVSGVVPTLKYKPIEYAQMGRLLCPAEAMEGPDMTRVTIELLGNNCISHQSDYPHPEAFFPDTIQMVMDWPIWENLGEDALRRFFWDNSADFFRDVE